MIMNAINIALLYFILFCFVLCVTKNDANEERFLFWILYT
jgi:hypothetical protein